MIPCFPEIVWIFTEGYKLESHRELLVGMEAQVTRHQLEE